MKRAGLRYALAGWEWNFLFLCGLFAMGAVWFVLPWRIALLVFIGLGVFVDSQRPVPPVDPR